MCVPAYKFIVILSSSFRIFMFFENWDLVSCLFFHNSKIKFKIFHCFSHCKNENILFDWLYIYIVNASFLILWKIYQVEYTSFQIFISKVVKNGTDILCWIFQTSYDILRKTRLEN